LVEKLSKSGLLQGINSDLVLNKPELDIKINRDLAADLGVTIAEIGRTLESLLGGRQVTRYRDGNEQYDVIVQLKSDKRNNPNDISDIYVRGTNQKLFPLSSMVTLTETVGPMELNHFSQRRAIKISAGLSPGVSIGEALKEVERLARETLPVSAQLDFDGQSLEYFESKDTLTFVFFLSLLFIFLVLAAQFESFVQPLVIVSTVPLALSGAILTILIGGGSLNVYSQIGLIALVGLIAKHGILIVEFANKCVSNGMSFYDAVIEAATLRFRPIIMTTISTICGALPLALASGPGSEAREQIGWIVVGGMAFGTFLTLFVLPTVYLWINICVTSLSTQKQRD
jgi:multidrug efflux pump